jgi:hypothetical protein
MAVLMGVFPSAFLRPMEASVVRTIDRVTSAIPAAATNTPAPSETLAQRQAHHE